MHVILLVVSIVVTVLVVHAIAERLRASAPLLLLLVGLAASFVPWVHEPALAPELVLVGILPPLLYAAAHETSLLDFRANLPAIGWLSVGLVLFTALGVALVTWSLLPVPFAAAFALGAIVGPPDAVAATAVARRIGLPRRVVTVLEGESLVNDATALVSLRTAIAALAGGVSAAHVGLDFARAVLVGVGIGLVVAVIVKTVLRHTDDPVTTTLLSLLTPFVAFAPTEHLHGSGVLAVVVAGLVLGHSAPVVQSARARVMSTFNWRTVTFVLENAVFLLVGLQTRRIVQAAGDDPTSWSRIALLSAAVLAAVVGLRVVWVFATRALVRARGRVSSGREAAIISWAGMRGVVTLAAAFTLPQGTPHRDVLVLIALVVTGGTLLLQGLTLPALARALDVHGPDPREDALQEAVMLQRASAAGTRAVAGAVDPSNRSDERVAEMLRVGAERRVNMAWEQLGRPASELETPGDVFRRLRAVGLDAERREVLRARDEGDAEHEVLQRVLGQLDLEELALIRLEERADHARRIAPALPESPCEHLAGAPCSVAPAASSLVLPGGDRSGAVELAGEGLVCADCVREGTDPVHLRLCLTCGNVGCCDSSVGRHATGHFEQTGHPVMRSIEPGESWRWCYVDGVTGAGE